MVSILVDNGLQTDVEQYAQRRRLAAEYKRQEDQAYNHSMARKPLESRQYQGWVDRIVAARPDLFMLSEDKRHQYKVRAAVARQNGILTNVTLDNAATYLWVKDLQKDVANDFKQFVKDALSMFKGGKKTAVLSTVVAMYMAGCTSDNDDADVGNDTNDTPDITHYLPTDDLPPTPTYVPTKPVNATPEPTTPTPEPVEPTPEPADKCPDEKDLPEQYLDAEECLRPELRDGDSDRAIDGNNLVLNLTDEQQRALANYIDAKFRAVYKILDGNSREYLGERTAGTNSTLQDTDFDGIGDGLEIAGKLGLRQRTFTSNSIYWPDPLHADIFVDVKGVIHNGTEYRLPDSIYTYIQEKFSQANNSGVMNPNGLPGFRLHFYHSPSTPIENISGASRETFSWEEQNKLMDENRTLPATIAHRMLVYPKLYFGAGYGDLESFQLRGKFVVTTKGSFYDPTQDPVPKVGESTWNVLTNSVEHELGHSIRMTHNDDVGSPMFSVPDDYEGPRRDVAAPNPDHSSEGYRQIKNNMKRLDVTLETEQAHG